MTNYVTALRNPADAYHREAVALATKLSTEATISDTGVIRWNSNNRVVPAEIVELAIHLSFESYERVPVRRDACNAARDAETADFLAAYRKARASGPSTEERMEARAAFGPGQDLVDVVTGYRWRT